MATNFRRKRRNSEPGLSSGSKSYKSFVTHWKLDNKKTQQQATQPQNNNPNLNLNLNQHPHPSQQHAPSISPSEKTTTTSSNPPSFSLSHGNLSHPPSPLSSPLTHSPTAFNYDGPIRFSSGSPFKKPQQVMRHTRSERRTSLPNINDPYFLPKRDDQSRIQRLDSIPEHFGTFTTSFSSIPPSIPSHPSYSQSHFENGFLNYHMFRSEDLIPPTIQHPQQHHPPPHHHPQQQQQQQYPPQHAQQHAQQHHSSMLAPHNFPSPSYYEHSHSPPNLSMHHNLSDVNTHARTTTMMPSHSHSHPLQPPNYYRDDMQGYSLARMTSAPSSVMTHSSVYDSLSPKSQLPSVHSLLHGVRIDDNEDDEEEEEEEEEEENSHEDGAKVLSSLSTSLQKRTGSLENVASIGYSPRYTQSNLFGSIPQHAPHSPTSPSSFEHRNPSPLFFEENSRGTVVPLETQQSQPQRSEKTSSQAKKMSISNLVG